MALPQPSDPTGANDTFYYAGTTKGNIYVTFTGGGGTANWTNITNGALAGNTSPILQIITNPNRGSNEAYAITTNGVYLHRRFESNRPRTDGDEAVGEGHGQPADDPVQSHLQQSPHRHQRADLST